MGYNIVNQSVLKKVEEIAAKGAKQPEGEAKAGATAVGKKTGGQTMAPTNLTMPKKLPSMMPKGVPEKGVPEPSMVRVIDEGRTQIKPKQSRASEDRQPPHKKSGSAEETPRKSETGGHRTGRTHSKSSTSDEGKERKIPEIPKVAYMEMKKETAMPFGTMVDPSKKIVCTVNVHTKHNSLLFCRRSQAASRLHRIQ